MTSLEPTHAIDVSIRTPIMKAAREKLAEIRAHERDTIGAPVTTMATVGRAVLAAWTPAMKSQPDVDEWDASEISTRGHRQFPRADVADIPARRRGSPDVTRAAQLCRHLKKVADPTSGTTLSPITTVKKIVVAEGLLDIEVYGKTMRVHLSAAQRTIMKPLRFVIPLTQFRRTYQLLITNGWTLTRALEAGLVRFAKTGKLPEPRG